MTHPKGAPEGRNEAPRGGRRTPDEAQLKQRVKHELRRRMKALRKALPAEARALRSARVSRALLDLADIGPRHRVAAFVAIHGEVDLEAFAAAHRARGGLLALPRVDLEAQRVVLHAHAPGDALVRGAYGIPEPDPGAPVVARPDAVLVPFLAADPRGHRVGYGKGFYDKLLPELEGAVRIAAGFDFQLVPEVPTASFDVPVDVVVTDTRVIRAAR
ncbi:MAG: 5-formyltetrahydrofolate cyclo-ligase [Myxococcota bacterium]